MYEDDDASGAAEEDRTPAHQQDDEGFLRKAMQWFKADRDHSAKWRVDAREDYDFVAGHQWSDEDKLVLKDQMRPEITFNRIEPTIAAVHGLEIGNRREVRFLPRTEGDVQKNEILTGAAEWCRDECNAEDEESDAFWDTIICGMGWVDHRMEYEVNPDGAFEEDRLDPFEMFWDCKARKRNLVDARRTWRLRSMPLDEARAMFPDAEDCDLDAAWARGEKAGDEPSTDADDYSGEDDDLAEVDPGKEVSILHLQWWEREPYYRVAFNGQMVDLDEDQYPKFQERAKALEEQAVSLGQMMPPMKANRQFRRKYMQAFIGRKVLERGPAPCDTHFSWECITGKRDHNAGTWYGLARPMIDPQRWANKWLSQSLHILNSNAKGGIFAEEGAFSDQREAEDTYARADRITWVKNGALTGGKILPKTPTAMPGGFTDMMSFAITSIRDASGVPVEVLGLAGVNQPGVLEEHRKQAGMNTLAGMFDSLRLYRKRQGRILLYYIQNYLSDGRLIRIVGEENEQYVPLIREPDSVEYDVIVDDMANSPNQKEKVWSIFQQMLPVLQNFIGPEEFVTMLEYSPFPSSVVQKLKDQQQQAAEAEAPIQEAQQQLELQDAQATIEKTRSETMENQAQAQKVAMEAQMVPMQAQADAQATIMQAQAGAQAKLVSAQMGGQARMVKAQQPPAPRQPRQQF